MTKEPTCARRTGSFEAGRMGGCVPAVGGVTAVTVIKLSPRVRVLHKFVVRNSGMAAAGQYVDLASSQDLEPLRRLVGSPLVAVGKPFPGSPRTLLVRAGQHPSVVPAQALSHRRGAGGVCP